MSRDYLVTICAECLCASCWHGTFMCQKARSADVRTVKASEMPLGPEHPSYYSPRRLLEVEGRVCWLKGTP